ncbi:hypothetical protein GUJ93_ZPchr0014g47278 [Zizania palustris]|uniref:RING-type domain-containing protein n=1 Tax=Zizania palustris TaxID=103762 RepID=A0A8J5W6U3_ZIZPA|nr:hypothetical protein GUJ93_ZPchr0014g47278 [Zizania palustris]
MTEPTANDSADIQPNRFILQATAPAPAPTPLLETEPLVFQERSEQARAGSMDDHRYVLAIISVACSYVVFLGLRELHERMRLDGVVFIVGQALRFFWGSMYKAVLFFVVRRFRTHGLPMIWMWVMATWMWGARAWWKLRVWTLGGVTTLDRTLADNCVICQERMEAGSKVRTLCCGHVFHKPCDNGMDIDMWLRENKLSCPVCRENKLSCSVCRKSTRLPFTACLCRRRRRISPL